MTTEEKQKFLYEEIIDAGLDAEEFQLFLENKNPDVGLDITRWGFNDLKKIVGQFKRKDEQPTSPQKRLPETIDQKNERAPQQKHAQQQTISTTEQKKTGASQPKVGFGQKIPIQQKVPTEQKKQDKSQQQTKQPQKPTKPNEQKTAKSVVSSKKDQLTTNTTIESKKSIEEKRPEKIKIINEIEQYSNIDGATREQIFSRSLNCERLALSMLFNLDVSVQIRKYETIEGGVFSQTYAIYTVDTPSQGWSVTRRYNDFVWLRETLEKLHPGLPIPPIPKKSSFRKFHDAHLKKRMMIMETFLNKTLTMPELKGEPIILDFLRLADNLAYLKFKKAATIEDDRIKLDKLKTLKGKVNLVIEPKISKFINLAKQNFAYSQPRLRKIYKETKAVSKLMHGSSSLLESISKSFHELSQECSIFNKVSELDIKSSSSYLYDIMKGLTHNLATMITNEAAIIQKYLYGVYKYEYINVISMLDSLGKIQIAKDEYRQYRSKLRRTKEKLLEDKNYSKWGMTTAQTERLTQIKEAQHDKAELMGMMLPKETETEIQLKEYYALINFQFYEETSRYMHHNPKFLSNILLEMSRKSSRLASQNMMLWADTMTNVMSFQQGRRMYEIEIVPTKK